MPSRQKFTSHAQYFAAAPAAVRPVLKRIQTLVAATVPGAEPCISYNIPAFRAGRVFFYFAAFKTHVGIYPPVRQNMKLVRQLAPFRGPKGNLSFPFSEPMPYALIGKVAAALAAEYAKK